MLKLRYIKENIEKTITSLMGIKIYDWKRYWVFKKMILLHKRSYNVREESMQ